MFSHHSHEPSLTASFPDFVCHTSAACGILVNCLKFKPVPLALEAQSLNHWTTGKSFSQILISTSLVLVYLATFLL